MQKRKININFNILKKIIIISDLSKYVKLNHSSILRQKKLIFVFHPASPDKNQKTRKNIPYYIADILYLL